MFLSLSIKAQKVIMMEKEGGVYKISCTVNGAKMKMIFDTGASSVSISMAMANYLFENDYITVDDIVGTSSATVANGSIINTTVIILKDIEISGVHIKNVEAVVTEGQNVPLLFGQSAIKKLGSYTINGNALILNNHEKENITEEENNKLIESIIHSIRDEQYFRAIEELKRLEATNGIGSYGYSLLARCYVNTKQYDLGVSAGELGLSERNISDENKIDLYAWTSMAYEGLKDWSNSIKYCEMLLQFQTDLMGRYYTYNQIAYSYEKLNNQIQAEKNYKKAAKCIMQLHNISNDDIFSGRLYDKELGDCLYSLALLHMNEYDESERSIMRVYAVLGAMCNHGNCISLCSRYCIDYRKDAKKFNKYFKSNGFHNLFD